MGIFRSIKVDNLRKQYPPFLRGVQTDSAQVLLLTLHSKITEDDCR